MKQIPDLQQIRIRDHKPVFDDVPYIFGNIDKNALEAAVQIKEAGEANVFVVCVGSEELEDTVKEALAAGADEARLVIHEGELESAASARLIAAAVKTLNADLLLFGEGSGDNYSSQVGSRVAQILGTPQVSYVSRIEIQGNTAVVTRSLEDCEEIIKVSLPAVISVTADLNTIRIPSVTQILKAGKKPKEVLEANELDVTIPTPMIATRSNLAPEMKRKMIQLKDVAELLQVLGKEGFTGGN
jgi:electron transfer flavoprotein beta subunit